MSVEHFDFTVLGSGPGGRAAAIQAAKAGKRVLVVERETAPGGACVQHGTIPSKTLRETALARQRFVARSGGVFDVPMRADLQVASLMTRLGEVVQANQRIAADQLARNGVEVWLGHASFTSPTEVCVQQPGGRTRRASSEVTVIATGSRPRAPAEVRIDHEHVLDSDSLLSMAYLPRTLTVLGAGVIACEYATIFAALGVRVTLIDKGERPLSFLDPELTTRFLEVFEAAGGRFLGRRALGAVEWDGVSEVVVTLEGGEEVRGEKLLCALGRVANLDGLEVRAAGLEPNRRGLLEVDAHGRTSIPGIYAVGDVIGPPALASAALEQGRRAVRHALGLPPDRTADTLPMAVYAIPELATVGLSEAEARARDGGAVVGRARFDELARGHIGATQDGFLKMVADERGRKLLGVQIVGDGASELIHVAQMALVAGLGVESFVDNVFNFPTLAEAYRVAALDIARQVAGGKDAVAWSSGSHAGSATQGP